MTGTSEEKWAHLCLDEGVERLILGRIESCGLSPHLQSAVQRDIEKSRVRDDAIEGAVYSSVASLGLDVQLKNAVYGELMRLLYEGAPRPLPLPPQQRKEPLDFIRGAQEEWEVKLRRGVNTLCTELGVPLSRERTPHEREVLQKKWNSLGTDFPDSHGLHPVFSPKDFLEVVTRVRNTNYVPQGTLEDDKYNWEETGGLMQIQLHHTSIHDLRQQFSALHPSVLQVEASSCEVEYLEKVNKVLKVGLCPLARQLCKSGCPVGNRRQLWSLALSVDTEDPQHAFHFEHLKSSVLKYSLLFETLLIKDVKKTAANDDNYFVFEDVLHQVLLVLLHDSSLTKHYQHLSITPLKAYIKGNVGVADHEVIYPPSGVVPFHGFSMYVAPLTFMFERPDHLYALFKQMYLRYFVHLHSLSSNRQGILSLCCLFESLLQSRQPELFQHLKKINSEPLRLAFGWIMSAFASQLDCRELLLLWDRIVGFDSLEIVVVLAVAVFEFRATNLFRATSIQEAEAVLADLRCLKVLPLLQQTLFL